MKQTTGLRGTALAVFRTAARDVAFRRLLLLLVTLHALDFTLTVIIFRLPGTFERNPVAAALFAQGTTAAALFKLGGVAAGALILVGAYHAAPPSWRRWLRWMVAALATVAAVNDVYSVFVLFAALSRR